MGAKTLPRSPAFPSVFPSYKLLQIERPMLILLLGHSQSYPLCSNAPPCTLRGSKSGSRPARDRGLRTGAAARSDPASVASALLGCPFVQDLVDCHCQLMRAHGFHEEGIHP